MRGFTWDSSNPPEHHFDRPLEEVARNGSALEQSILSERKDLSREVFLILAEASDINVLTSLAMNETTPPEVLDRAAERLREAHAMLATSWHASPELKKMGPLAEHVAWALGEFLDQVGATDDERRELMKRYDKLQPPGGPLLGDVWAQIRPEKKPGRKI
ncbi:hypothetical protein [Arthrobacter sp. NPDC056727]|uniref:hypothetical protein n=1 Tax=Arthrobacter sp. NPDC056727 TaxID=3345927 RepID=UPI003670D31E